MNFSLPAPAALILEQIASVEAPKGWDTVYGNNMKAQLKAVGKPLTKMTFDEVVADGPRRTKDYGSSACGRFQFMRDTLDKKGTTADLKGELNLSGSELFNKELQNYLALHLLKRRGYDKYMTGKLSRTAFGNNLAKEWASYPVLSGIKGAHRQLTRGQTYYAGDAQNKVLISPEVVEACLDAMKRVSGLAPQASPAGATVAPLPIVPGSLEAAVASGNRPSVGGFLARVWAGFGGGKAAAAEATKFYKGDPVVYSVQEQLQQRGYYMTGTLDGNPGKTDGSKTRTEINAIRLDNGMPQGYIDDEFLARLPTFGSRPVSKLRESGDFATAKAHAPDLAAPVGYLWKAGAGLLTLGGVDAAKTNGFIGQAQTAVEQGQAVIGDVQSAINTAGSWISWIIQYRFWILIAIGLYLIARAASFALDFVNKFKRSII